VLARETGVVGPHVGKYSVNVSDIDRVAVPCMKVGQATSAKTYIIIDEIGINSISRNMLSPLFGSKLYYQVRIREYHPKF
jgi:nucleoside-triphosphatase THEP1